MRRLIFPLITVFALVFAFFNSLPAPAQMVYHKTHSIPNNVIRSQYSVSLKMEEVLTGQILHRVGGTAVAIGKRELISAAHVFTEVQNMTGVSYHQIPYDIDIRDRNGEVIKRLRAKVTKIQDGLDLALLSVDEDLPYFVSLGTEKCFENLEIGSAVYLIGSQYGYSPYNISCGNISSKVALGKSTVWQISSIAYGGNSGGGVFESETNQFIGIVVSVAQRTADSGGGNVTFIIPLDVIREFCN